MSQIITKHKNRYKVFQILLMYNACPYFSLKNLGNKVHVIQHNMIVADTGFIPVGPRAPQDFSKQKSSRQSGGNSILEESSITQYLKLKEGFISCITRHMVGGGSVLIGYCFFKNGNY